MPEKCRGGASGAILAHGREHRRTMSPPLRACSADRSRRQSCPSAGVGRSLLRACRSVAAAGCLQRTAGAVAWGPRPLRSILGNMKSASCISAATATGRPGHPDVDHLYRVGAFYYAHVTSGTTWLVGRLRDARTPFRLDRFLIDGESYQGVGIWPVIDCANEFSRPRATAGCRAVPRRCPKPPEEDSPLREVARQGRIIHTRVARDGHSRTLYILCQQGDVYRLDMDTGKTLPHSFAHSGISRSRPRRCLL